VSGEICAASLAASFQRELGKSGHVESVAAPGWPAGWPPACLQPADLLIDYSTGTISPANNPIQFHGQLQQAKSISLSLSFSWPRRP